LSGKFKKLKRGIFMSGLERIFAEITDFSKMMGSIHNDFLIDLHRDIERLEEKTKNLSEQMKWQGWTVMGISAFSGSLAIVGSLIPKASSATPVLSNPRLGAHDGISNGVSKILKSIGSKLGDNEFLRSTCITSSKFFGEGLSSFVQGGYQSKITGMQSKIELLKTVCIQNDQQGTNFSTQQRNQIEQTVLSILQSKAKGS
jgi:hypothetical protein